MSQQNLQAALDCIRGKLQPLNVYPDALHDLTSSLLCESLEDLKLHASWLGPTTDARACVMDTLRVRSRDLHLLASFAHYCRPAHATLPKTLVHVGYWQHRHLCGPFNGGLASN
jgi:hypothetical protein